MNHGGHGEHGERNAEDCPADEALVRRSIAGRITGPEARWNLAGRRQPPEFGVREKSAPEGAEEMCVDADLLLFRPSRAGPLGHLIRWLTPPANVGAACRAYGKRGKIPLSCHRMRDVLQPLAPLKRNIPRPAAWADDLRAVGPEISNVLFDIGQTKRRRSLRNDGVQINALRFRVVLALGDQS
jgi:hypothetical protein